MITTLVVDDERFAREGIRLALKSESDVKVVGEAADGASALQAIARLAPDLVFLDIRMPGLDGFDVVDRVERSQTRPPIFVFVTAFDQYAAKAFEVRALHYLLKPVDPKHVVTAVQRARIELAKNDAIAAAGAGRDVTALTVARDAYAPPAAEGSRAPDLERVVVRVNDRFVLLKLSEVDWVESAANYLKLHARGRWFMLRMTMAELEEKLGPRKFVRIHRSTIVNVDRLVEVKPSPHGDFDVLLNDGTTLRMSRGYRYNLLPR
jgi:two-component system, LytTR family, response regulator